MAVTLAESCISQQIARDTPRLIGAQVDLSAFLPANRSTATSAAGSTTAGVRLDALLFGETQGRIVITTSGLNAVKVVERAKLLGIKAARIGTRWSGVELAKIATGTREYSWPVTELYDAWWNSLARAMR